MGLYIKTNAQQILQILIQTKSSLPFCLLASMNSLTINIKLSVTFGNFKKGILKQAKALAKAFFIEK